MGCQSRLSQRRWLLGSLGLCWALVVGAGLLWIVRYQMTPGKAAAAVPSWPDKPALTRSTSGFTLLMFVHPQCPCSRASIGELARIMSRCRDQVAAQVIFMNPAGQNEAWSHTDLWRDAAEIPGVTVRSDAGGRLARQFGAVTSGQVMLYRSDGRLLFVGGITGSRGHWGDNAGEDAVVALLQARAPAAAAPVSTPVYGCRLESSPSMPLIPVPLSTKE